MNLDRFEGFPYTRVERKRSQTALECWREEGYDPVGDMPVQGRKDAGETSGGSKPPPYGRRGRSEHRDD